MENDAGKSLTDVDPLLHTVYEYEYSGKKEKGRFINVVIFR